MLEWRGLVVHITQGNIDGNLNWQMNPSAHVSYHFTVARDGRAWQLVDTNVQAWAQRDGNSRWLSVGCEGFVPATLTQPQLNAVARIFARANRTVGVPLQNASHPNHRGLGHHSMGAENGFNWGNAGCPGINIVRQKPDIIRLAGSGGPEVPDMSTPAQNMHAVWNATWPDPVHAGARVSAASALLRSYRYSHRGVVLHTTPPTVHDRIDELDAKVQAVLDLLMEHMAAQGR